MSSHWRHSCPVVSQSQSRLWRSCIDAYSSKISPVWHRHDMPPPADSSLTRVGHTVRMLQVRSQHSIGQVYAAKHHQSDRLRHLANASEATPATASLSFRPLPVAASSMGQGSSIKDVHTEERGVYVKSGKCGHGEDVARMLRGNCSRGI